MCVYCGIVQCSCGMLFGPCSIYVCVTYIPPYVCRCTFSTVRPPCVGRCGSLIIPTSLCGSLIYLPPCVGPVSQPPATLPGTPGLASQLQSSGIPLSPPEAPASGRNPSQTPLYWWRGAVSSAVSSAVLELHYILYTVALFYMQGSVLLLWSSGSSPSLLCAVLLA